MKEPFFDIHNGDARKLLSDGQIPEVHCVVTSPPYFNQRKYGEDSEREIGRGKEVSDYIRDLVNLFDSIPLHPDGSIWVNIGDKRIDGALMNVPARFSIAMMDKGFDLIDHVIWAKSQAFDDGTTVGNCMTEPCYDRLNGNGHEPFFRFVRQASKQPWADTLAVQMIREKVENIRYLPDDLMTVMTSINGRNLHNVWNVLPGKTSEKHYAVFPPALCERPIAMTCPLFVNVDGSLPRRIVEKIEYDEGKGKNRVFGKSDNESSIEKKGRQDTGRTYIPKMPISRGWQNVLDNCTPGVVFDPFSGTATTGEVALKMGRSFIGIDLYEEYVQIAKRRCTNAKKYVQTAHGYDRLYEMLSIDQTDLKHRIETEFQQKKTIIKNDIDKTQWSKIF